MRLCGPSGRGEEQAQVVGDPAREGCSEPDTVSLPGCPSAVPVVAQEDVQMKNQAVVILGGVIGVIILLCCGGAGIVTVVGGVGSTDDPSRPSVSTSTTTTTHISRTTTRSTTTLKRPRFDDAPVRVQEDEHRAEEGCR